MLALGSARAAAIDTGTDIQLRWDTTLRETLGLRIAPQDASLLAQPNGDDGDRAFAPGLISSRLDIVSLLDISRGDLGASFSAEGWYDPVYQGSDDDRASATFNPVSVPPDEHPADVRALQGGSAELLDGFVHDKLTVAGLPVSVRIGRQTLLWGESLFFASNGIAAGQAPVDAIKSASQPLAEARELFLPVTQAQASVALRPDLIFEVYDQFEWRRNRLPGVTSYFSTSDFLDVGGQRLFLPDGRTLGRVRDRLPEGTGQFGAALRLTSDNLDLGLYALRFDAKAPEVFVQGGGYGLVYPRGIQLYGASFSTYVGEATLAGEVSWRSNMPLVSRLATKETDAPYAAGDTVHAQLSSTDQLPPGRFWAEAALEGEIAADGRLSTQLSPGALAPGRSRYSLAARAAFTPAYYQMLPGLDLRFPVGGGIGIAGRSSIDPSRAAGAGDVEAGVAATYRAVWDAQLLVTHFIGGAGAQALADRDFVSVSLARSF